MQRIPEISVLMPVKNCELYVAKAIDSILSQTFKDFELIVIDDGSTDRSHAIVQEYVKSDCRIRLLQNKTCIGLPRTLNRAISQAYGKFLARMDADDVSLPTRLQRQLNFLKHNPDHIAVGSNTILIDSEDRITGRSQLPKFDHQLRWYCLLLNPIAHPTVMLRANMLKVNNLRYEESYFTSQDWELWSRCLAVGKMANIQKPLLKQRIHASSVSATKRELQILNSIRIQNSYLNTLTTPDRHIDFHIINKFFLGERETSQKDYNKLLLSCEESLKLADQTFSALSYWQFIQLIVFITKRIIIMNRGHLISKDFFLLIKMYLRKIIFKLRKK